MGDGGGGVDRANKNNLIESNSNPHCLANDDGDDDDDDDDGDDVGGVRNSKRRVLTTLSNAKIPWKTLENSICHSK